MLYAPCRDAIYKGAETSPTFISSCLQLPLSNSATAFSSDALIEGELEPNAVAMFSSRVAFHSIASSDLLSIPVFTTNSHIFSLQLGVSLFLCLLDACARNSQRDDPTLLWVLRLDRILHIYELSLYSGAIFVSKVWRVCCTYASIIRQ